VGNQERVRKERQEGVKMLWHCVGSVIGRPTAVAEDHGQLHLFIASLQPQAQAYSLCP
jgi:hypothetical protein